MPNIDLDMARGADVTLTPAPQNANMLKLADKLPDGHYRTAVGSEMWITRNGGKSVVEFDWLEENGCIECRVEPYEQDGNLVWHCDECGGGSAVLQKIE